MTCDFNNPLCDLNNSKGHCPIKTKWSSINRFLLCPAWYVHRKVIENWEMLDSKASTEFPHISKPLEYNLGSVWQFYAWYTSASLEETSCEGWLTNHCLSTRTDEEFIDDMKTQLKNELYNRTRWWWVLWWELITPESQNTSRDAQSW